jgi:hypothetical protein
MWIIPQTNTTKNSDTIRSIIMKVYTIIKQDIRDVDGTPVPVYTEAVKSFAGFNKAVAHIDSIKNTAASKKCTVEQILDTSQEYCSLAVVVFCPALNERIVEFYTVEASELAL